MKGLTTRELVALIWLILHFGLCVFLAIQFGMAEYAENGPDGVYDAVWMGIFVGIMLPTVLCFLLLGSFFFFVIPFIEIWKGGGGKIGNPDIDQYL
jgi:hypothetical protein